MVNSHIGHPIKNLREFTTTNRDTYTKKKIQRIQDTNTGRLQKSSVPIGTLCYWRILRNIFYLFFICHIICFKIEIVSTLIYLKEYFEFYCM